MIQSFVSEGLLKEHILQGSEGWAGTEYMHLSRKSHSEDMLPFTQVYEDKDESVISSF